MYDNMLKTEKHLKMESRTRINVTRTDADSFRNRLLSVFPFYPCHRQGAPFKFAKDVYNNNTGEKLITIYV